MDRLLRDRPVDAQVNDRPRCAVCQRQLSFVLCMSIVFSVFNVLSLFYVFIDVCDVCAFDT